MILGCRDDSSNIFSRSVLANNKAVKVFPDPVGAVSVNILMTATQPLIFKKDEALELFDAKHDFDDRVKLQPYLDDISLDNFVKKVNRIITGNPDKSILVIMNTINSAIFVFEKIKVFDANEKFFLSARIVPFQRRERIQSISDELDNKRRVILVSTQVVEAGIDFDFDIVIRDLAPIDSIIQAAGRCNRNGQKPVDESLVHIFAVCDDNGNYFATKIYGNTLIQKALETLQPDEAELKVSTLADVYYRKVAEGGATRKSKEILDAMKKLDYDYIDDNFKVIEEEPNVSIFVEVDKQAAALWNKYEEMFKNDKSSRIREFFRVNREQFYSYVVNGRNTDPRIASLPEEKGFRHIPLSSLSDYYSYTGLKESPNIL